MNIVYSDLFLFHVPAGEETERRRLEGRRLLEKVQEEDLFKNKWNSDMLKRWNRSFYIVEKIENERITVIVYLYVCLKVYCAPIREKEWEKFIDVWNLSRNMQRELF
jgi:hypothetical protein